jgi:hypothetical protein
MNCMFLHRLVPAALCAVAATAASQPSAPAGRSPDPLDARASVPALRYDSALGRDRTRPADGSVAWREANDNAARIGGWRAYARLAQPPASAASAAPVAAGAANHTGHAGGGVHSGHPGHKSP